MAEPTKETENINAIVPRDLKKRLVAACGPRRDGLSNYTLSEVVRIMLARAFEANMHLRLDEDAIKKSFSRYW